MLVKWRWATPNCSNTDEQLPHEWYGPLEKQVKKYVWKKWGICHGILVCLMGRLDTCCPRGAPHPSRYTSSGTKPGVSVPCTEGLHPQGQQELSLVIMPSSLTAKNWTGTVTQHHLTFSASKVEWIRLTRREEHRGREGQTLNWRLRCSQDCVDSVWARGARPPGTCCVWGQNNSCTGGRKVENHSSLCPHRLHDPLNAVLPWVNTVCRHLLLMSRWKFQYQYNQHSTNGLFSPSYNLWGFSPVPS